MWKSRKKSKEEKKPWYARISSSDSYQRIQDITEGSHPWNGDDEDAWLAQKEESKPETSAQITTEQEEVKDKGQSAAQVDTNAEVKKDVAIENLQDTDTHSSNNPSVPTSDTKENALNAMARAVSPTVVAKKRLCRKDIEKNYPCFPGAENWGLQRG